jgi:hypothetical protein
MRTPDEEKRGHEGQTHHKHCWQILEEESASGFEVNLGSGKKAHGPTPSYVTLTQFVRGFFSTTN